MRKSTLITASVATLSALYVAQNIAIGNQPQALVLISAEETSEASISNPGSDNSANVDSGANSTVPEPEKPAESSQTVTDTPEAETAPPTETESTASKDSTPAETQSQPAPAPEPAAEPEVIEPQTVASDVVEYQYGVIQLELTHQAGTIMNVSVLQGDTSYGRGETYAALINATVAAQGTNFGNYSGATFTTEAFRDAVASATAKF